MKYINLSAYKLSLSLVLFATCLLLAGGKEGKSNLKDIVGIWVLYRVESPKELKGLQDKSNAKHPVVKFVFTKNGEYQLLPAKATKLKKLEGVQKYEVNKNKLHLFSINGNKSKSIQISLVAPAYLVMHQTKDVKYYFKLYSKETDSIPALEENNLPVLFEK